MANRPKPLQELRPPSQNSAHLDDFEWFRDEVLEVMLRETGGLQHGGWIYRGEPELYDTTSSTLFRKYPTWGEVGLWPENPERRFRPDYNSLNNDYVEEACRALGESDKVSVESRFRHAGGLSNKIDFTDDINIALFFACNEKSESDGRIVALNIEQLKRQVQASGDQSRTSGSARGGSLEVSRPPENHSASGVQRSVLIGHPNGYLPKDTSASRDIRIPAIRKTGLLEMLRILYGIDVHRVFPRLEDLAKRSAATLSHTLAAWCVVQYLEEAIRRTIADPAVGKMSGQTVQKLIHNAYDATVELDRTPGFLGRSYRARAERVKEMARQIGISVDDPGVAPTKHESQDGWRAPGIPRFTAAHDGVDVKPWMKVTSSTGYAYEQTMSNEPIIITIPSTFLNVDEGRQCFVRVGCEGYTQGERRLEFDLSPERRRTTTTLDLQRSRDGDGIGRAESIRITIETCVWPMTDE